MPEYNRSQIKKYCLQFYRELRHPYVPDKSFSINPSDLETAIDFLDSILSIESGPKAFRGLGEQFYAAFGNYLSVPRSEIASLCVSVDKLSALTDPFLKKVAFILLSDQKHSKPDGQKIPLWKTSNYVNVLEALGLTKVGQIYKKNRPYWEKQPARLALLRDGFTARQKGVHESHIHNLEELERIVYATIGTYVIVCLKISEDSSTCERLSVVLEKRRAAYLLQERVRSFPFTHSLFSKKEQLLIYRHRTNIAPDIEGKKLLFVSHLAGRGPCFYWFNKEDKTVMTAWAKEMFEAHSDETIKTNAFRFLINSPDLPFQLRTVVANFPYYEDKEELARYIKRFTKPSDRDILLKLSTDKREEVYLASQRLVVQMFPKLDGTLKKMAISTSASKRKLLRLIIKDVAREGNLALYRDFTSVRDKAEQILNIYCLGETGKEQDLKRILKWLTGRKHSKAVRAAGWFSISRIANRLADCDRVWSLINKKERIAKTAALTAMTREGIGPNFRLLFSNGFVDRYNLSEKILEIVVPGDSDIICSYLSTATLDYHVRDLVLALCKIGTGSDFQFLFRLFSKYQNRIDFHNHVRVADSVATICTRRQSQVLKKILKFEEFWSYILPAQRTTQNRLPIGDVDNQAFMRRLIAACIIENSSAKDVGALMKLVRHYYKWIAHKAAERLSKLGGLAELNQLTEDLWKLEDEELDHADAALHALCTLDKKLHLDNQTLFHTG